MKSISVRKKYFGATTYFKFIITSLFLWKVTAQNPRYIKGKTAITVHKVTKKLAGRKSTNVPSTNLHFNQEKPANYIHRITKNLDEQKITNVPTPNELHDNETTKIESKHICVKCKSKRCVHCKDPSNSDPCRKACRNCCSNNRTYRFRQKGMGRKFKKCAFIKNEKRRKKYCKGKTKRKCSLACEKNGCRRKSVRTHCTNGKTLKVDLMTDKYPYETTWKITNTKNSKTEIKFDTYNDHDTFHSKKYCLKTNGCYFFTITDSYDDGICCGAGKGSYQIHYDGTLVQKGGDFTTSEVSPLFGNCFSSTGTPTINAEEPTSIETEEPTSIETEEPTTIEEFQNPKTSPQI